MRYLDEIDLSRLSRCPIQLRAVRKHTLEYIQLRDSIRAFGQLVPILARPKPGRPGDFEPVDGANRYEILDDLRAPKALCVVQEMTDAEVLRFQIVAHATRIETTPMEYAHRLWQIANIEQTLTIHEIAHSLHQTVDWVQRMMRLVNLGPKAREALHTQRLSVSAAIELAKLPIEQQDTLLPLGDNLDAREFRDLLRREARHNRQRTKQVRVSKLPCDTEPSLRHIPEVLHELNTPTVAASILTRAGATTALDGWKACLSWVWSIDPASVERRTKRRQQREARERKLETDRISENNLRRTSEHGES